MGYEQSKFTMTVDLANDFAENTPHELGRIVRVAAEAIRLGGDTGKCRDVNGNTCGEWRIQ